MEDLEANEDSWTPDIELVLGQINQNADYLQEEHRRMYHNLKTQLYYYRIPVILLSSINSVFSVGLTTYLSQPTTSGINSIISLSCACISAIELFVGVDKALESSLASYHGYKLLTMKISTCLKLQKANREIHGTLFLKDVLNDYSKLMEQSNVLLPSLNDVLVQVGKSTSSLNEGPDIKRTPLHDTI
jgi:hypothetical protein